MKNIEFSQSFEIGGKPVTSLAVKPITFIQLVEVWEKALLDVNKPEVALQRGRILNQCVFKNGDEVLLAGDTDINKLPRNVAKEIISSLDDDIGPVGEVVIQGDGATSPIVYKLGTPFAMTNGKDDASIKELEFLAATYGEVEEILATTEEMPKAAKLIRTIAKPINSPLQRLPEWAIDKLTVGDGIQIMRKVLPSF